MIDQDRWLVWWVKNNYEQFYETQSDIMYDKMVANGGFPFNGGLTTERLVSYAVATKYEPIPKNIFEVSKKSRTYNVFVKKLIKHMKQNQELLLFYEL